jgi:superfamily II DNA or RNA helicase
MILESLRRAWARQARQRVAHQRFYASSRPLNPSPEQLEVVKWLETHNIVVSARPGAGKTATAEALVQDYRNAPVAVITYLKRLQLETQKRLRDYGGVDTYTFHGLAGRLFGRVIRNDIDLIRERASAPVPLIHDFPQCHFVVLDELQDMTDNLYWLASTFIASVLALVVDFPGSSLLVIRVKRFMTFEGPILGF